MAGRAVVNPDWRFLSPLFDPPSDPPAKASRLTLVYCEPDVARQGIADWHSRLPYTQSGPWKFAFVAHYRFTAFAVALWNNPSARTLPNEWLELRRMAVSDDAPHCTASWFLAAMARRIRADHPDAVRLISYQDEDVHTGTIYKAAGWTIGNYQKARQRDRTTTRPGGRLYRTDTNGEAPAAAGKYRWETTL